MSRIAYAAGLLSRHGVAVMTAAISAYSPALEQARAMASNFVEIFLDAPLEECVCRDLKGLYARALAAHQLNFGA